MRGSGNDDSNQPAASENVVDDTLLASLDNLRLSSERQLGADEIIELSDEDEYVGAVRVDADKPDEKKCSR